MSDNTNPRPIKRDVRRELHDALRSLFGAEYATMYFRLVDWGLCWLNAGESGRAPQTIIKIQIEGEDDQFMMVPYRDPDPDKKPRQWSRAEIEAAGRLHSRVIRLPRVVHRMVLQVFFNEYIAEYWHTLDPRAKETMIRDLTTWNSSPPGVNARLRMYNRECATNEPPIHWTEFESILHRAIKILCNNERMLP